MKIKNALKYRLSLLSIFSIIMTGCYEVLGQTEVIKLDKISPKIIEEEYVTSATVFGGVGRRFAEWQAGLDFFVINSPHYKAFRNQLELNDRVLWGEWWYSDSWGIKTLFSDQTFTMFGAKGNGPRAYTNHAGVLSKIQQSLSESWKMSAGLGLAKTEFVLENNTKLGNSLISEFRIGFEISSDFWMETAILTIDSASGSGQGDQRLGSTGYLIGFSYGI